MQLQKIKDKYATKDGTLYGKKNIEDSLAMLYHENSKFTTHSARLQGEKIASFNNPFVTERSVQPFKNYPTSEKTDLSLYTESSNDTSLLNVLQKRRSLRSYDASYKISLNELTTLLYHSYGVTHRSKITDFDIEGHIGMRNVPSGGGLYPLELYVVIFNGHMPAGLYHYDPAKNQLELLQKGDFMRKLLRIIQAEPYVNMQSASALIISTGIVERLLIKYGDRGYRFLMQESGFVAQTISLLAESVDLGTCMLGGYIDDRVNSFLGVDGVFETVNNIIVVGKREGNSNSCEV